MSNAEQRVAARRARCEEMLVKVLSSDTDAEVDGRIYVCTSADVSSRGLQLHSTVAVSPDARLDLRVRAGELRFVLTGRVRWSQPAGDGCVAGIEFEPVAGDDMDGWMKWVNTM
jgi:hypothetical protein